jgi:hypothetical protein
MQALGLLRIAEGVAALWQFFSPKCLAALLRHLLLGPWLGLAATLERASLPIKKQFADPGSEAREGRLLTRRRRRKTRRRTTRSVTTRTRWNWKRRRTT